MTSTSCGSAARTSCATSWCGGSSPRTTSTPSAWRPSCARGRRAEDPAPPVVRMTAMLEVEVIGMGAHHAVAEDDPPSPTAVEVEELCALALSSAGIEEGHVAIEFVDEERIQELNLQYRQIDAPTDVLSFGVDEDGVSAGPRELGDIVICPPRTEDLREAVVHGALHLSGMDHETDDGEMLALQAELMRWVS